MCDEYRQRKYDAFCEAQYGNGEEQVAQQAQWGREPLCTVAQQSRHRWCENRIYAHSVNKNRRQSVKDIVFLLLILGIIKGRKDC